MFLSTFKVLWWDICHKNLSTLSIEFVFIVMSQVGLWNHIPWVLVGSNRWGSACLAVEDGHCHMGEVECFHKINEQKNQNAKAVIFFSRWPLMTILWGSQGSWTWTSALASTERRGFDICASCSSIWTSSSFWTDGKNATLK